MNARSEWWALPDRGGAGRSNGQRCDSEAEANAAAAERSSSSEVWAVFRVRGGRWSKVAPAALSEDTVAGLVLVLFIVGWASIDFAQMDALLRGWL